MGAPWENLQILDKIEAGSFGSVFRATDRTNGNMFAVKVINIEDDKSLAQFDLESSIAHEVSPCKYCITTVDTLKKQSRGVLVMEYVNNDLHSLVESPLTEMDAKYFFLQVCRAVKFLHDRQIAHLDIKAENILVDNNDHLKLCDFGYAQRLTNITLQKDKIFGSLEYAPPEVRQGICEDLLKVDIWCLGILLHYLLTTRLPTLKKKRRVSLNVNRMILSCSSDCTDLLRALLQINPSSRPSIHQILAHDWLQ